MLGTCAMHRCLASLYYRSYYYVLVWQLKGSFAKNAIILGILTVKQNRRCARDANPTIGKKLWRWRYNEGYHHDAIVWRKWNGRMGWKTVRSSRAKDTRFVFEWPGVHGVYYQGADVKGNVVNHEDKNAIFHITRAIHITVIVSDKIWQPIFVLG